MVGRTVVPEECKSQHKYIKSPSANRGFFFFESFVWATRGGCPYGSCPPQIFIGAWRPCHSPVGAGSCALPASAGPGVSRSGGSIPSAHTVCVPVGRTDR